MACDRNGARYQMMCAPLPLRVPNGASSLGWAFTAEQVSLQRPEDKGNKVLALSSQSVLLDFYVRRNNLGIQRKEDSGFKGRFRFSSSVAGPVGAELLQFFTSS